MAATARKAKPVVIAAQDSVRKAAASAIAEGHAHFLDNARRLGPSVFPTERVHQARVGVRRLRTFLRLFRPVVGKARATELNDELRWLFGQLGRVRDLEVFADSILPSLALAARTKQGLQRKQAAALLRARSELADSLKSERYLALCRALAALESELASARPDERTVDAWLARRLTRRHKRALRVGDVVSDKDAHRLHTLRKELKKLRYIAELAEGPLSKREKRLAKYRKALKLLQDVLGTINDLHVASELVRELLPDRAQRKPLLAQLRERADAAHGKVGKNVSELARAKPFWR